ncbi:MAG: magnesium chelatase, partial [Acidimicrobiales bacterium]
VVLRPTGSVEVAKARLTDLATGGRTPLAAGILAALDLAEKSGTDHHRPMLVVITDGRATAGDDAVAEAHEAAARVRRRDIPAVIVDAEDGPTRLGLARELATAMGARLLPIAELSADALCT